MPLRPVPCKVALRTMSPGAPSAVMPLRPPVTARPSIATRLAMTLMTSIAGSGPLTVAPEAPAASVTSLRSISRCSLQVPLIWTSKGLRSSPRVSALAIVSPAEQSTATVLVGSAQAPELNAKSASAAMVKTNGRRAFMVPPFFVISPFPPWEWAVGKSMRRRSRRVKSPQYPKRGNAFGAGVQCGDGSQRGAPHEQTRTPHFGRRGGRVPGGRRDHAPALPRPAPGPFRRQRRQSGEEQGFLLPAARLSRLRPARLRPAAARGQARGRRHDGRVLLAPRHRSPFVRVFSQGRLRGAQPAFAETLGHHQSNHVAGRVAAGSVGRVRLVYPPGQADPPRGPRSAGIELAFLSAGSRRPHQRALLRHRADRLGRVLEAARVRIRRSDAGDERRNRH